MSATTLFHYTQCGLDNVWLVNGHHVEETEYGEAFSIDRADELHRTIAARIVADPRPMRGQEARFLRTMLDLSPERMGALLGVDRATVIRWEKQGHKALSTMQDIAVRSTWAAHCGRDGEALTHVVIRELQRADDKRGDRDFQAVFETSRTKWRAKRAA